VSKAIGANLKTHIESEVTTVAALWKVTRRDNTVLGFTDHDEDIDYGGTIYKASSGFIPSALSQTGNLAVNNLDVHTILSSVDISEADLLAGKYDYATIDIYLINYSSVGDGIMKYAEGWKLGEVKMLEYQFVVEIRSKTQLLHQNIVEIFSPDCRTDLGDTECAVTLEPSDWQADTAYSVGDTVKATTYNGRRYICSTAGTSGGTEPTWDTTIGNTTNDNTVVWTCYDAYTKQGTVSGVTDRRTFAASSMTDADEIFNYGKLTWLTGDNADFEMEVKDWDLGTTTFVLFEKMPYVIQVGDTFKVTVGCDKQLATCRDTYDNIVNFRGEPYIPGLNEMLWYP